jgi:hypothetical protein
MIIYGTRGRVVSGPMKNDAACPDCGRSPLRTAGVIRYFHVFWIPLFPYRRLEVLECPACKAARVGPEVPEPARSEIRRGLLGAGRMAPLFAGLALLAGVFVLGAFSSEERGRREAAWLAAPAVQDHYVVRLPEVFPEADRSFPYGVLEVAAVQAGRVTVRLPNIAYDRAAGATKAISSGAIRKPDYYADETVDLELAELQALKTRSALHSVVR